MYAYQVEDVDERVRQDADDLARHDRYCDMGEERTSAISNPALLPRNKQETHRLSMNNVIRVPPPPPPAALIHVYVILQ